MTVSERVALANAIAERLQGRQGRPEKGGNISTITDDAGKTRDIAAAKAGLGSGKTLEAAQKVIERGAPELPTLFVLLDHRQFLGRLDGEVVVERRAAASGVVHRFVNKVILVFKEPVLINPALDPVGELALALDELPQVTGGASSLAISMVRW